MRQDGWDASGSNWSGDRGGFAQGPGSGAMSSTGARPKQHPRSEVMSPQHQQKMGGVGLVFCRDGNSPYLVVKSVVNDGPASRCGLIHPGDRLCCINDFDLAWSEKTPRSQQPQLPGSHGSAVTLTFDHSADTTYPERFTITLIRNVGFYPDRLSSTPLQVDSRNHPRGSSSQLSPGLNSVGRSSSNEQKQSLVSRADTRVAVRSAASPLSTDPSSLQSWMNLDTTPQVRRNQQPGPAADYTTRAPSNPSSPGAIQSGLADPWGAGNHNPYDSYPASQSSEIDDLIQEIARNDQIVELQSKLSSGEIEHEKQIKEFQRKEASLQGKVDSLRLDLESAQKRIQELEKERKVIQADRDAIARERDSVLDRMKTFEKDVRGNLQELQQKLDTERAQRQELEQSNVDASILRQVQTEKELLERQNEDLTRQLIELKMLLRAESQQKPHGPSGMNRTSPAKGNSSHAWPTSQEATDAESLIPGLQMDSSRTMEANSISSRPQSSTSEDVEMHMSPKSARFNNMGMQGRHDQSPQSPPQSHPYPPKSFVSPKPQLISQQPPPRYQNPDGSHAVALEPPRTTPVVPKLNLPRTAPLNQNASTGVKSGIGMSFHPDPTSGRFIITDVHPQGPAGQAVAQGSMSIGDSLLAVNGFGVQGMTVSQIVEDILGPPGTSVMLTIGKSLRGDGSNHTTTLSLVRARPGERKPKDKSPKRRSNSPSDAGSAGRRSKSNSPQLGPKSASPPMAPKPASPQMVPQQHEPVVLPPGWVVEVDPSSGRTYYVNHTLKTFSWARPASKVPSNSHHTTSYR